MLRIQPVAVLALTILFALGSQKHVSTLAPGVGSDDDDAEPVKVTSDAPIDADPPEFDDPVDLDDPEDEDAGEATDSE